jgi:hypothetical protein
LKEQIIAASMDAKGTHIRDLLQSLNQEIDLSKQNRAVAVCYCGSNDVAQSLADVSRGLGVHFEHLAHAD